MFEIIRQCVKCGFTHIENIDYDDKSYKSHDLCGGELDIINIREYNNDGQNEENGKDQGICGHGNRKD